MHMDPPDQLMHRKVIRFSSEHNTNHQLHYTTLRTSADIAASHFDLSHIPSSQERDQILSDFILIPNYLSITEHDMLIQAAFKKLKRALGKQIRYEDGHFDNVITRYRECSASEWGTPPTIASGSGTLAPSSTSASTSGTTVTAAATAALPLTTERSTPLEIMQSLKLEFFPHSWNWVSPHILELESGKGGIQPHVDHLEASGEVVAGLCLGSSAVMELIHEHDPERYFRVLLPKNCFYFQRGSVRYHYKHGIPIQQQDHTFRGKVIPKENRVSIMLRNALEPSRGSQTGYNLSM
ncbi:Alpha-ketoglutarate-dependent dioxygenase alkB 7, mitochondrial [Mortierella claussenii]|nr:Alpha-ketoglutarate-dependent dioxygenase alkB 7, mitochondrial [Mortierella claussenii]